MIIIIIYVIKGIISVQESKEGLANALEASVNEEQGNHSYDDDDVDGDGDDDDDDDYVSYDDDDDDSDNILIISSRQPKYLCSDSIVYLNLLYALLNT